MTLQEAIEMLGDYKMQSAFEATPAFEAALKLGQEALKRFKLYRHKPDPNAWRLLPGETEE